MTQLNEITSATLRYSPVTLRELNRLPSGTVAQADHAYGLLQAEPLIVAMDAMLQYAQSYKVSYGCKLFEDAVLGQEWLDTVKGLRGLLNGNGAIAMLRNRGTDSKDNGAVESMFWAAMEIAGYKEEDL